MNESIDTLDESLRKHLEGALATVPPPITDGFSQLQGIVRRQKASRALLGVSCAVLIAVAVVLVPASQKSAQSFEIVSATSPIPTSHRPLPPIAATTEQGQGFSSSAYRGRWLVMTFVTPKNCTPCLKTEQGLAVFAGEQDEQARSSVVLVNEGPGSLDVTRLRPTPAGQWTVIDDSAGAIAATFRLSELPFTVVVSPSGDIVGQVAGIADSGIIDYFVVPSQLVPLATTRVGDCTVTIAVAASGPNADFIGRDSWTADCPNVANGAIGIHDATLFRPPAGITLVPVDGVPDDSGYSAFEYLVTSREVVVVQLVDKDTGHVLASMAPAWASNLGLGFVVLVAPSSFTDNGNVVTHALDSTGTVVAVDSSPPGTSQGPPTGPASASKQ